MRHSNLMFDLVGLDPVELIDPPGSLREIINQTKRFGNFRVLPYSADPKGVLAGGRYYVSTSKR